MPLKRVGALGNDQCCRPVIIYRLYCFRRLDELALFPDGRRLFVDQFENGRIGHTKSLGNLPVGHTLFVTHMRRNICSHELFRSAVTGFCEALRRLWRSV